MGELPAPDLNYLALPHRVLADNVKDIDPGAVGEYARVWQDVARALFELGQDMQAGLNNESGGWRGATAEAVFHFSSRLAHFAERTGESDVESAKASDSSASVGSWAKNAMPEPVEFDRQAEFNEAGARFIAGDVAGGMAQMEDLDRKQRAAEEAHREAARISTQHAMTLHETHSRGLEFAEPPSLSDSMASVNDSPGSKVGGIGGSVPSVGAGGATSASSANAPTLSGGSPGSGLWASPGSLQGGTPGDSPGPGKVSGTGPAPSQGPPTADPSAGPASRGPGVGAGALLPVRGPGDRRATPRTNKSPFSPTGHGAGGRPGGAASGPRMTGGPGAPGAKGVAPPGAGKATGGVPGKGQVQMGGRAAAAAAGARPGVGPAMTGGAGGRKDDDKEHKNKYVQPQELEDGLYDENLGYSVDPQTGNTLVRPVIGEDPDLGGSPAGKPTSRPDRSELP